jgi:dUTP pyrophosphatase
MTLKYTKTISDTPTPRRAYPGDAGLDLVAMAGHKVMEGLYEYDVGVAFAIPEGYVGILAPRSSVSGTGASLANSIGIIDEKFRGSIKVRFYADHAPYSLGDRIAQLVLVPFISPRLECVNSLDETTRSTGAFGSSGK